MCRSTLLDHFVGAREQRGWHGKAERLSVDLDDKRLQVQRLRDGRGAVGLLSAAWDESILGWCVFTMSRDAD